MVEKVQPTGAHVHGAPTPPLKDAGVEAPNPDQLSELQKRKKLAHSMYPTAKQDNAKDGR